MASATPIRSSPYFVGRFAASHINALAGANQLLDEIVLFPRSRSLSSGFLLLRERERFLDHSFPDVRLISPKRKGKIDLKAG